MEYTKYTEVTKMTVNDIYFKCSNVDEDTRFVIDTKEPVTVYDGTWYYMNEDFREKEVGFFSITKTGKKNKLPHAKEVFVSLAE